jgi:hypothetical protein
MGKVTQREYDFHKIKIKRSSQVPAFGVKKRRDPRIQIGARQI